MSVYALSWHHQAGSWNFTRFQFPLEEAVQLHLQFWGALHHCWTD